MTVSKRLRFEILRRDNYTCRYCGASAPDVTLTVDHVVAVALGGHDHADNLVAACKDCNAGKSATAADSSIVEDVREDALRHAEMVQNAYRVLVERIGLRQDYQLQFTDAYEYQPPPGWEDTLRRWHAMAVPIELVTDAAARASGSTIPFRGDGRFRYLCGIVWNQITAIESVTAEKGVLAGRFILDAELDAALGQSYATGRSTGRRLALLEQGVDS